MKPRTSFEKQVVASNWKLPYIAPDVIQWALKYLIEHPAFRTASNTTTCGDCGHTFHYEGKETKLRCPKCGNVLKVKDTLKRKFREAVYFATLETIDGLQVERVFLLSVIYRKGVAHEICNTEICRLWLNPQGKFAVTSLARTIGFYKDTFNWSSKIELRSPSEVHWVLSDTFVFPRYKLLPELRRNGMKGVIINCHPFQLMKALLSDPRIETMMKAGDMKAVKYFLSNTTNLELCWQSYKIAKRNGYIITDFQLWCDTIRLLDKCGKDIHSAKYICPTDLKTEHDKWNNKVLLIERKRMEAERVKRAQRMADDFYKNKSCYFGIVIKDSEIEISVLDSIEAYKAEGDAMHHCVFNCEYYAKEHSIVLSAHDKNGNRIETVEFSLDDFKVIQSRGVCNKNSEQHDRIVNLVNENAHLFMKAKATA